MNPVLYVEDSLTSQALMRRFLKGTCELVVTPTVEAARKLLDRGPFSLLITDFLFPEGDATDLILQVRHERDFSTLPIIVVSSAMDRVLFSRVLRAGANDAVAKPIDPPQFREMVGRMMTQPYVREQEHGVLGVCCFQWQYGSRFHQYCPELNFAVAGNTKDEASQRMIDALSNHVMQGNDLGSTRHESMVTHVVPF